MIKSKYIVIFILSLLTVSSCKKDKTPACGATTGASNCEDIQNIKHFFYFKVGSWWVYEEETSGDLDTVYVTEAAHNPLNYDFDVRVYSTYQDYYYHFWPEYASGAPACNDDGPICQTCLTIKRSKYKPGNFIDEAKCMFFIPEEGQTSTNWTALYNNNKVSIQEVADSFSYSSFNYNRTITVHEEHTRMEDYQESLHFFSEDVGLIRKELIDSSKVWNLIDYYIQL